MAQVQIRIEKKVKLELRLNDIEQVRVNDSGLQGHNDEVYASSGVASRSDKLNIMPNGKVEPVLTEIKLPAIENVDLVHPYEDEGLRPSYPFSVHTFYLESSANENILFSVHLYVIEHDNGDLGTQFKKYGDKFKGILTKAVEEGAGTILGAAGAAVAGPVGQFIGKEILGRGLGLLLNLGVGEIIDLIAEGLDDDILDPFHFVIQIDKDDFPTLYGNAPIISNGNQVLHYHSKGAYYKVNYEWLFFREIKFYNFSFYKTENELSQYKANEKRLEFPAGRCSGAGFTASLWTINRDLETVYEVRCVQEVEIYEWKIDGHTLVCDGNLRSLSLYKSVNRTDQYTTDNINVIVEYTGTNFSSLKIRTKGQFGNYDLKVSLNCYGRNIIAEDVTIGGQEFSGDKKYIDYVNCIYREINRKLNTLRIKKIEDFVPNNGAVPFEVFGSRIKQEIFIAKNSLNIPYFIVQEN